jgi:hypothetical protein
MTSRNLQEIKSSGREQVVLAGSFAPAGTGAPTTARGVGFTVARSGVGTFVLTLDRVYSKLIAGVATVQLAASADTQAQLGSVDLTAKTIVIRLLTAGSDADVAANANNRVNFVLVLGESVRS